MAHLAWEKPTSGQLSLTTRNRGERLKFLIGGVLILIAIAYLILSGTASGARYFITVEDVVSNAEYVGQTVRLSGAVIGESIVYDPESLTITFTIVHIPEPFDDLATALHESVNNPNLPRISVRVEGQPKPDLLRHEAQVILTGKMGDDGVFYASELLPKCPSRFEENAPSNHPTDFLGA